MAADLPKLDHVLTLKMSKAQLRQCKARARAMKLRFSTWARLTLVEASTPSEAAHTNGSSNGSSSRTLLAAPVLPARG